MTGPARAVALRRSDVVAERAFSHPDHIVTDRATMRLLIEDVRNHVLEVSEWSAPVCRYIPSEDSWYRRVILPRPEAFATEHRFVVVGFFGRRRDDVTRDVLDEMERLGRALAAAVPTAPGVLAYSTHLLADERNYANLVLFDNAGAIEEWRNTAPHPMAAEVVSPLYYDHVRIYRGSAVTAGSDPGAFELSLECVKYRDYRSVPVWHAVRQLGG